MYDETSVKLLQLAVMTQAVKDYKRALEVLRYNKDSYTNNMRKKECELFFRGPYLELYSDLDGETIIKAIKAQVPDD